MKKVLVILFILLAAGSGCGYTLKTTPPHGLETIHVETFKNETYEPGLEIDLTNGILSRFLFDGSLRVTGEKEADAVLRGRLTKFVREPLRYTSTEEIEEYRLVLAVALSLWDTRTQTVLWEEKNFVGDTSFFVSGPLAKSEEKARQEAISRLARRIVDRTVEEWPE
ncbi:MAG: LptE family protein [Candidatus Omnitrophica bacterium]|nr:LptE family protein [Candidatus Omnitrophota bacterium]